MQITKYIVGLSLLILTTFLISPSKAETCTTNDLGDRTCTTSTAGTTTGNVLNNSTFGTSGYSTSGWTISGDIGHGHSTTSGTTYTGQNTSGGVLALEEDSNSSIYQDVDLVGDGHLTKSQINEGFTSTMSADIWFWNNVENTTTLKQTITTADGTVTTQTRNINDHDPNRSYNAGQWTNYTDSYTHNSNTETDFTIRAEVSNSTPGQTGHFGPDVDNVQLSITTAGVESSTFTPCEELGTCTDAGEAINDAVNLTTDDGVDLFTDLDTKVDDAFKEVEKIDDVKVEEIKFEVIVEDDLGEIEEVKFDEFVEMQFTSFLEENNLVEDFKEELKVEGISEEEFFDELGDSMMKEIETEMMAELDMKEPEMLEEPKVEEIKEEELNEETVTEETQMEEVKEEETLITEKPKEEINETESTTTESMEETPNESTETGETSENVSTESDVAENKETESETTETSNEEGVESEETGDVKSNVRAKTTVDGIEKKVEKVIAKVMAKLKKVDQQLAAIQLIKTKGISAGGADISGYINKKVYTNQNQLTEIPFYSTVNILEQSQIYGDKSLVNYTSNDPILQQQVALVNVQSEINTLRSEIYALKESIK